MAIRRGRESQISQREYSASLAYTPAIQMLRTDFHPGSSVTTFHLQQLDPRQKGELISSQKLLYRHFSRILMYSIPYCYGTKIKHFIRPDKK